MLAILVLASLLAAPARIVSTSPAITETLFALGIGDRVVGVSEYCRFPARAAALPKVGSFLKPDAELIARLNPDLVLIHASQNGVEGRLARLGLRYAVVERGTVEHVRLAIASIGEVVGMPHRASEVLASIDAKMVAVRRAVAGKPRPRVLIVVSRRAGTLSDLVAVGRDGYLNELVAEAGGVNVLDDGGLPEYPRISMETVLRLKPDIVVDAADMGDTTGERQARQKRVEALWRAQPLLRAAGVRVVAGVSDAFFVPGPRMIEIATLMAAWFHGVRVG